MGRSEGSEWDIEKNLGCGLDPTIRGRGCPRWGAGRGGGGASKQHQRRLRCRRRGLGRGSYMPRGEGGRACIRQICEGFRLKCQLKHTHIVLLFPQNSVKQLERGSVRETKEEIATTRPGKLADEQELIQPTQKGSASGGDTVTPSPLASRRLKGLRSWGRKPRQVGGERGSYIGGLVGSCLRNRRVPGPISSPPSCWGLGTAWGALKRRWENWATLCIL